MIEPERIQLSYIAIGLANLSKIEEWDHIFQATASLPYSEQFNSIISSLDALIKNSSVSLIQENFLKSQDPDQRFFGNVLTWYFNSKNKKLIHSLYINPDEFLADPKSFLNSVSSF